MGDPLSILGAAVGVTSLIFQVVDECIKGYHFYCKVVAMPVNYQYLVIRMQMEETRFLKFSQEAGLLWREPKILDSVQTKQSVLLAVLAEIRLVFDNTKQKLAKHVRHLPAVNNSREDDSKIDLIDKLCLPDSKLDINPKIDGGTSKIKSRYLHTWRNSAIKTGRDLREIVLDPRRLAWAFVDEQALKNLLARLDELNSFLFVLLDEDQKSRLRIAVDNSYREIIQIREDVHSLKKVLEALQSEQAGLGSATKNQSGSLREIIATESIYQVQQRLYLAKLAETKIQYQQALLRLDNRQFMPHIQPLDHTKIELLENPKSLRTMTRFDQRRVWIEWTSNNELVLGDNDETKVEDMLKLLTDLVRDQKLKTFRLPSCLGYICRNFSDDETQFGMVYENADQGDKEQLITLRQVLTSQRPSLSQRIGLCTDLAECVYNFHTIGWLHKGIRSDNVVFFAERPEEIDLSQSSLLGLQLSRPGILDELTMKAAFDPSQDIYRHPQAQSSAGDSRYRISYDLYSLGLVFTEIILWKPIEMILGIEDLKLAKPRLLRGLRNRFTQASTFLDDIAGAAGDALRNVISTCLNADVIEKPISQGETEISISIRLQRMLGQDIIATLKRVGVGLADNHSSTV